MKNKGKQKKEKARYKSIGIQKLPSGNMPIKHFFKIPKEYQMLFRNFKRFQ